MSFNYTIGLFEKETLRYLPPEYDEICVFSDCKRRSEYQVNYLIRNFDEIFGLLPNKMIYFYGIFFYGLLGLYN